MVGSRTLLFSYGSGLAATMFSINCTGDVTFMRDKTDVINRLNARTKKSPEDFTKVLTHREATYTAFDTTPVGSGEPLLPGTYSLAGIDKFERRSYVRNYSTAATSRAPLARIAGAATQQSFGRVPFGTSGRLMPNTFGFIRRFRL